MPIANRKTEPGDCPSKVADAAWLYAIAKNTDVADLANDCVGKWLVFASPEKIDDLWRRVVCCIEDNRLTRSAMAAKVSTSIFMQKGRHVICVYTSDFRNKLEVGDCLSSLRQLGISGVLNYKTDLQTQAGHRASTYSSKDFERA